WLNPRPPVVFVIGQRAFGFPDAPLQKSGDYLSFVVPTAVLAANPELTVQTLFPPLGCLASMPIDSLVLPNERERLQLLEQGDKIVKFLLFGTRLTDLNVLAPVNDPSMIVKLTPITAGRIMLLEIDARHLKTHKNLLVQRPTDERPFLIAIPSLEAPKKP